jgi:hypothetical protein
MPEKDKKKQQQKRNTVQLEQKRKVIGLQTICAARYKEGLTSRNRSNKKQIEQETDRMTYKVSSQK